MPVDAIASKFGVERPAVYKALRRTGALPPYKEGKKHPPRKVDGSSAGYAKGRETAPRNPILIPDRTPCPRCGVRADIGCRHQGKEAA